MTGILNYGVGNILAFKRIFKRINCPAKIVDKPDELINCDRVILPGVGHFDVAMNRLLKSGLKETLDDFVINKHKPLLGICVGMQMLGNTSEEGCSVGLGYIPGHTKKIDISKLKEKPFIPHMGWNDINILKNNFILKEIDLGTNFYFLHSYCFVPSDSKHLICESNYGNDFCAIASKEKIFGIQFHPEKSHSQGIQVLKNFSQIF